MSAEAYAQHPETGEEMFVIADRDVPGAWIAMVEPAELLP